MTMTHNRPLHSVETDERCRHLAVTYLCQCLDCGTQLDQSLNMMGYNTPPLDIAQLPLYIKPS